MWSRVRAPIQIALLALLTLPVAVQAHAALVTSVPTAEAIVTVLPAELVLTFDEALAAGSSADLINGAGATIATWVVDPADPTSMRVPTPDLPDGKYEIRWTSRADDGDIERGIIQFRVAIATPPPSTAGPSSLATDQASSAPSPEPTTESSPAGGPTDNAGGGNPGEGWIPIGAGALLLGTGLIWLLRRRPSA